MPDEKSLNKASLEEQISYALGYDIFDKLKETIALSPEYFFMGAKDSLAKTPMFTEDQLQKMLMAYQRIDRQKQIEAIKREADKNQALGSQFLDENKKKEGVVTLSSGLQYKIITQGTGPLPKETDIVECHYEGRLIDGTVFDSSYKRGKPAVFQVSSVIKGWIEALQKMPVGSKWMLYIPPELAYGDQGAGAIIKPGDTLIFEVEILSIVD
ncbi:MAG: FKBP-type peptidyl-prolyl cis-trans isomerase [Proteobacteria bacterium]|nr:FKBP-type peptidyl-prolyl cis-trans isomerase [Pseudomonadota bacterium]MBU1386506.1 FKBP-type peptidyl-prolyl cis-trans isomerase [Pseudomonadota bacterium]MBU1544617.1 FKBP-type peptidyl-prolyl cis-trans isomerase [Pseudomonadota bacterium]MBU2430010.1 FKBP-type peptidyl-prolyl cis-trans isomerase [Pseudomonadota bacterium]MBU2481404.1 FKBP-type peptidyl-prolyl cis-trans isomerase [Pseudomonadota bacterium]